MTDEERESLRQHRVENFTVKVEALRECFFLPGEIRISTTHNGNQWVTIATTEDEAKQIVNAIAEHYKWDIKL